MKNLAEKHQNTLNSLGIPFTLVGPYGTTPNIKLLYQCAKGHTPFLYDKARMRAGKAKCPDCDAKTMTHTRYERELMERDAPLYPIEAYKNNSTAIKHSCINDHITSHEPRRVLSGAARCSYCAGVNKKTHDEYQALLDSKGIKYTPLVEYDGMMRKLLHRCYVCDHEWDIKPHDIVHGYGCPVCAKFGFNRNKPAILYYVRLKDKLKTYYKIGVTNKTLKDRLRTIPKEIKVLMEKYYEKGYEALAAEQMILEEYSDMGVKDKDFLPNGGYTELFKYDVLLLDSPEGN